MFCPKCGKEIKKGGSKFCPYCGAPLKAGGAKPESARAQSKKTQNTETKNTETESAKINNSDKRHNLDPKIAIGIGVVVVLVLLFKACGSGKEKPVSTQPDQIMTEVTPTPEAAEPEQTEEVQPEESAEEYTDEDENSEDVDQSEDETEDQEDVTDEEDAEEEIDTSLDKDGLPNRFSDDEKKELKDTYETAYEDEKNGIDAYILEAINNYDRYEEIREHFDELADEVADGTESLYQMVNDYDPNLKNVLTEEAEYRVGSGPLGTYLVGKGVDAVLSDNELGQELRSALSYAGTKLIEGLTIWGMQEKQTARKDSLEPVTISDNYMLVRTLGTISEMMGELKENSGYTAAYKVLTDRYNSINGNEYLLDYVSQNNDICTYEDWITAEVCEGRLAALKEKAQEWDDALTQWEVDYLKRMGIKDAEKVISADDSSEESLGSGDESDEDYDDGYEDEDYDEDYDDASADEEGAVNEGVSEDTDAKNISLGDYLYCIMDKDGNVCSTFFSRVSSISAVINNDGMCSITDNSNYSWVDDNASAGQVILNKDGEVLFKNDKKEKANGEKTEYYNVTPSGNILRRSWSSDYDHGDYQKLEWVQPDGTAKTILESGKIKVDVIGADEDYVGTNHSMWVEQLYCTDYYTYECGYGDERFLEESGIIDMTTGKLLTEDEYNEMKKNAAGDSPDDNADSPWKNGTALNADYVLCDDIVYDKDDKEAAKLDEGRGVADIVYAEQTKEYWVVTRSGYYYVMDEKFKKIMDPVKLAQDDNGNLSYRLTKYGLLQKVEERDDDGYGTYKTALYDDSGNVAVEISGIYVSSDSVYKYVIGSEQTGWMNLNTKDQMIMEIPEGDVKILEFAS